jgi:hypothetical protein
MVAECWIARFLVRQTNREQTDDVIHKPVLRGYGEMREAYIASLSLRLSRTAGHSERRML